MRSLVKAVPLAAVAVLAFTTSAFAASAPWTANPGTSINNGVVTLNSTAGPTSYENANLDVPVENGDTITFDWRSPDNSVACAGGVPRVFIQGGAYNTFDQDPAGPGACGTDANGDSWFTVTGTISGITNGTAGSTGIVNDNTADPGTIQVRNLVIAGVAVLPPGSKAGCKKGGWKLGGYRNQGQCIKAMKKKSKAKSPSVEKGKSNGKSKAKG